MKQVLSRLHFWVYLFPLWGLLVFWFVCLWLAGSSWPDYLLKKTINLQMPSTLPRSIVCHFFLLCTSGVFLFSFPNLCEGNIISSLLRGEKQTNLFHQRRAVAEFQSKYYVLFVSPTWALTEVRVFFLSSKMCFSRFAWNTLTYNSIPDAIHSVLFYSDFYHSGSENLKEFW